MIVARLSSLKYQSNQIWLTEQEHIHIDYPRNKTILQNTT